MPRGWLKANRANDFNDTSRYFGQAHQSTRNAHHKQSWVGHISLRPAGTSPTLGEDYLFTFQGRHAGLPKTRITNNLGWSHISLRPAGTSPTLGEDYLFAFQGRHASLPLRQSTPNNIVVYFPK